MITSHHSGRRGRAQRGGFALVTSMFALVIVAALVTGAFFAAEQELRVARNSRDAQRAFGAAESAVDQVIADWDGARMSAMAVGDSLVSSPSLPEGSAPASAVVFRLNNELYLVRAVGGGAGSQVSRTIGRVVRVVAAPAEFAAALLVQYPPPPAVVGSITPGDQDPPGWACDSAPRDSVAGVLVGPDSVDWDLLVSLARTIYEPSDLGAPVASVGPVGGAAACDESLRDNWGEPVRPAPVPGCAAFFPVVLARGDLTLSGGRGQGLLLVDGDLTLQGGFEFAGAVIVRGALSLAGSGTRLRGAVLAESVSLGPGIAPGAASVSYSSCALRRALGASTRARPLDSRSWAELY